MQHLRGQRRSARLEHDRLRVQRPEEIDAQMDERNDERREDAQHSGVPCAQRVIVDGAAQDEIAHDDQPEKERGREPGVPRPPRAPDRFPPHRAGQQHGRRKHQPDLGGAGGEPVEPRITQPQIERAGQRHEREREVQRDERGRRVDVEDLLGRALPCLDRREVRHANNGGDDGRPGHNEEPIERRGRAFHCRLPSRVTVGRISVRHCSIVEGYATVVAVTKTRS